MATITKLKSGKWRALIRMKGHETMSRSFSKKSDASKWATQQEDRLTQLRHFNVSDSKLNLREAIEIYLDEVSLGKTYRSNLLQISDDLGHHLLSELSEAKIRPWAYRQLKQAKGITVSHKLSALSTFLKWVVRIQQWTCHKDAAVNIRKELFDDPKVNTRSTERNRLPTDDELSKLFDYFAKPNTSRKIPMIDIIRFSAVSGLRLSETAGLKAEDVDLHQKTLRIEDRKSPDAEARVEVSYVPLFDEALVVIEERLASIKKGYIFWRNPKSISAAFTRACKAIGIEDLHAHDLRHESITRLFALGHNIPSVAMVSGHKDWKHLRRYTNLKPEDFHAAHERQKRFAEMAQASKDRVVKIEKAKKKAG